MAQSSSSSSPYSSSSLATNLALFIVVLAQLATITTGAEIIDVFRWVVPYNGKKDFEANVGDTIVFRWQRSMHNVYIHPTMSCDMNGAIFVGAQPGTEYTFTEADGSPEGNVMFFACDIGQGGHCNAGQNILVKVFPEAEVDIIGTGTVFPSSTSTDTIDDINTPAVDLPVFGVPDLDMMEDDGVMDMNMNMTDDGMDDINDINDDIAAVPGMSDGMSDSAGTNATTAVPDMSGSAAGTNAPIAVPDMPGSAAGTNAPIAVPDMPGSSAAGTNAPAVAVPDMSVTAVNEASSSTTITTTTSRLNSVAMVVSVVGAFVALVL